ncbi:MAG: NOP5/NOP56 family protein [Candidatus Aenigmatarchaeota archaeon]
MNEKAFLVAGVPGVFALDSEGNILACSLFPKDGETIEEKLSSLEEGERIEEVDSLLGSLSVDRIVTSFPFESDEFKVSVEEHELVDYFRENMRSLAMDKGFADDEEELNEIINRFALERAKKEIKSSVDKDKVMAQAVSALEDLKDMENQMTERLREWYGLYNPELDDKRDDFVEKVIEIGKKEDFEDFTASMGIELDDEDVEVMQDFAKRIRGLKKMEGEIRSYLEREMMSVAPNTTHILGAELTAKLISIAGSLEKLAKMPSSKIQLLGAEKALFRHVKGGGKSPKYGVIFKHPYIQKAKEEKRGKVARAIAAKVMMSVRTDFYTDDFKGEMYEKELKEKMEEIGVEDV